MKKLLVGLLFLSACSIRTPECYNIGFTFGLADCYQARDKYIENITARDRQQLQEILDNER